ncbi:pericentrin isoform X1 [Drosophila busckii]|uniref:pericentrin isoform X1 n=1 Tax=Drosophila busckii TaxID=30019 RepID=UPI00083F48EE|nr:pericentrin isoform X1 [Drosophila busckii]
MSLTAAGTVARSDSSEWLLPVVAAGGGKCTTVTMLLAQRIARNDCWSVDDERLHHSNKMNVWQTLEYLSGLSQRKRFNYDGFADTQNLIRTLTPSWRRDSFAEKAKAEALAGAAVVAAAAGDKYAHEPAAASVVLGKSLVSEHSSDNLTLTLRGAAVAAAAVLPRRKRRSRRKKCQTRVLTAEYALTSEDLQDLVKCTFNLPRISARLERLMGTNVVKLTDRAYMKELRERIDEDYRRKLLARIKAREIREVERERLLIIEGKTNIIPEELADDPIFMVNKDANIEIQKERSKLKTSREKNAERLKLQGVKWERERLQHAAKEAELLAKKHERQRQQKLLVEQYRMEDAERGMDLLRIDNEEWRECEQNLKEFLEQERAKMKERSLRVPKPFSSDPQDILNIVRARQKFRETELRIRNQLDDSKKEVKTTTAPTELDLFEFDDTGGDIDAPRERSASFGDYPGAIQIKYMDDASDVSEESVKSESLISLSVAKQQYAEVLQEEMDEEFNRGLLISKQQYDQLRYEDEKIVALRNAKNILELYQLAEEIITGGPVEEEEHGEEGDEEAVQEKTEPHSSDDDGGE